jgi:voltage-gated potassium channel Kch
MLTVSFFYRLIVICRLAFLTAIYYTRLQQFYHHISIVVVDILVVENRQARVYNTCMVQYCQKLAFSIKNVSVTHNKLVSSLNNVACVPQL